MAKEVILTKEGLNKLEQELEYLRITRRKEIAERIKLALSFGDLSENSEYDEAKNEQALTEARINELENILKNVKLIDENKLNTEFVHIGCKVEIKNQETSQNFMYKIVGSSETNPIEQKISDESPVGRGLLGRRQGEVVNIKTPGGIKVYEIIGIYK
ncbi:MAG: transcription elongation factor GreA [Candidatus Improbicoccus devescovinae]|nr:MAG: transcription elongation factor GreA [Candidatus Improbicoccus devescovinae]